MSRELRVYVDVAGVPISCGRLWARPVPRESSSFEYDASWLKRRDSFALDPELPLSAGPFHTPRPLFRAFTDPAPDRWGQTLLRRAERARAKREGRAPHTLSAVDFLVQVEDETRLGALRFSEPSITDGGSFLSNRSNPVPPILELPRLLAATNRVIDDEETEEDLALVLAPGTSLGGARPKASVRETNGQLTIAKFPRADDEWPVTRWEAVTLSLAKAAGIVVPAFRVESVLDKPVLILSRFDRQGAVRIPFMSAMTALSADDNSLRSYLEVAEVLRREGVRVQEDLTQLWRRIVFNILVSNTDDHLRNHGFQRQGMGWCLAPAYDLNPMPVDVRPRIHALAIDEADATSSLDIAFKVARSFGLAPPAAREIAREVGAVVRTWRSVATSFQLKSRDQDRMESAFEHADLEAATSGGN